MLKKLKNALILTIITLVAGTALSFVYTITKEPIEKAEKKAQMTAYQTVFPEADSFESVKLENYSDENSSKVSDACEALDKNGNILGYVLTTASKGYGGDIQIAMGVKNDGTLTSISILDASDETPGLGAKCKEETFYGQFKNMKSQKIDYSEIDAISGATYSTKGVLNAINAGLCYADKNLLKGEVD